MKSPVIKRSVVITGHKTSVSLEDVFWKGLKEIAEARRRPLAELLVEIDRSRQGNFSSAIRTFVFNYFHAQIVPATADGFQAGMPDVAQGRTRSAIGSA